MTKIEQDTYTLLCGGGELYLENHTFSDRLPFSVSDTGPEFNGYTYGDIKQVCFSLVNQGLVRIEHHNGNWLRIRMATPHEIAEWKNKVK